MKSRKVGEESQKTHDSKQLSGFFNKYMSGNGLDIGYSGYIKGAEPILPTAIGVDRTYKGYDGTTLPFNDASMSYVYSSHCLEHIVNTTIVINEWFRVLKIGGFMVIVVPHQHLYEKKHGLPSKFNEDHKRFYTPGSLLDGIEKVLRPNTYRVRLLEDGDTGFDYTRGPELHSGGQYEITLVLEKIAPPTWELA